MVSLLTCYPYAVNTHRLIVTGERVLGVPQEEIPEVVKDNSFTIILGIPSKILGLIVGLIEGYVIAYIILFIVSQPFFNFNFMNESKYASTILNKSPILSKITKDGVDTIEEIYKLTDITDSNTLNLEIIDITLDKEVTDVKVIDKLIEKKKLNITNIDSVLDKYR